MKFCSLCLAINVNMRMLTDLQQKSFLESYLAIQGVTIRNLDSLDVCFECEALLKKSFNFLQKVILAQHAIDVESSDIKVNAHTLTTIRNDYNLNSTLSYHKVQIDMFLKEDTECHPNYEKEINPEEVDSTELYTETFFTYDTDNKYGYLNKADIKIETKVSDSPEYMEQCEDQDIDGTMIKTEIPIAEQNNKQGNSSRNNFKTTSSDDDSDFPFKKLWWGHMGRPKKNYGTPKKVNIGKQNGKKRGRPKKNYGTPEKINIEKQNGKKRGRPRKSSETKKKDDNSDTLLAEKEKKKRHSDSEFIPSELSSSESDSSYDQYDDNTGRKLRKPPREYPRICDHCDYEIEAGKYHYKHYLIHHTHEQYPFLRKGKFVCQHCGITKNNNFLLQTHEATHGDKTIPCTKCDKKFSNKVRLNKHISVVHDKTWLYCDFCKKGFTGKSDLRLHIRTHTGEKPFKCHVCDAAFAHRGNLNLHLRNYKHEYDDSGNILPYLSRPGKNMKKQQKARKRKLKRKKLKSDTETSTTESSN